MTVISERTSWFERKWKTMTLSEIKAESTKADSLAAGKPHKATLI